ncbi:MAG TPA: hypothetical protein VFM32_04070 [Spongiibacteraceae bacterium]|nr:hypothetical protein [Spongiibacteraceae bacterium]
MIEKNFGISKRLLAAVIGGAVVGCTPIPPINTITTNIDPKVVTLAATQGKVDPTNTCSPASPAAPIMPDQWWNNLPITQQPKVVGSGVVGFERWRNHTDGCQEFRQDLYRTAFSYDLSGSQSLKGLVTKAELSFSVVIMPATSANSMCQAMTGGGGSLFILRSGFSLPQMSFSYLGTHVPPQPFPSGLRVFGMNFPWVPGQIATGVTTYDVGGQRAGFTVDVTDRLNGALNRGDTAIGFMLTGSEEDLPQVSPSDGMNCRTVYHVGQLVIKHL